MAFSPNEEVAGPAPTPVTLTDRLPALDVLRGFALLGILTSNIYGFSAPTLSHDIPVDVIRYNSPDYGLNYVAVLIQWLFFEGKMRALFAALFGAGTVLLLERIGKRRGDGTAANIFHRRNMWLVLFGLMHGLLIWEGDILSTYGFIALLALYPFRSVAWNRLVVAGVIVSILGNLSFVFTGAHAGTALQSVRLQEQAREARLHHRQPTAAEAEAVAAAETKLQKRLAANEAAVMAARGSYLQQLPANIEEFVSFREVLIVTGGIGEVMGLMLVGMGLYKVGFITGRLSTRIYGAVAVIGYVISLPVTFIGFSHAALYGFNGAATVAWLGLPYSIAQIAGMFANASIVLLLVRADALMPAQRGLAAVGRTAFSNYILTSLICQFVFRWSPLKLYGTLDYTNALLVMVAVWAINIVLSLLWLRVFAYGPLEWLWRSLTYWHRQPMRQGRTATAIA